MPVRWKFLKTNVIKDDRKYNYLKDGQTYRVYLTLPNTTDNVPHEVRYGGQDSILIGTFEKDTYETEYGYRATFNDTWVLHPMDERESIDVDEQTLLNNSMHSLVKHRKATGEINYILKNWTTIAKKVFRVFVASFDQYFAESIRDRQEPVVNIITKEYRVPFDTSYNKPAKPTYIRITDDVNIIRNLYGQAKAEAVAGKVFMVDQWCVDSKRLHHRPQNDVNAVVTREELNRVIRIGKNPNLHSTRFGYQFSSGLSFYPRMFEVVAFQLEEGYFSNQNDKRVGPYDTLEDALDQPCLHNLFPLVHQPSGEIIPSIEDFLSTFNRTMIDDLTDAIAKRVETLRQEASE